MFKYFLFYFSVSYFVFVFYFTFLLSVHENGNIKSLKNSILFPFTQNLSNNANISFPKQRAAGLRIASLYILFSSYWTEWIHSSIACRRVSSVTNVDVDGSVSSVLGSRLGLLLSKQLISILCCEFFFIYFCFYFFVKHKIDLRQVA